VLVACVAVAALGALTASAASAGEYRVEGKAVSGPTEFTGSGGPVAVALTLGGSAIAFGCKQSLPKGSLEAGGSTNATITFKECAMTQPPGCKLPGTQEEQILFYTGSHTQGPPLKINHRGTAGAGEEFFTFTMEGSGCAFPGTYTTTGYYLCELREAGVEAVEHEEVCKKTESHLKWGTEPAKIGYSEKIKLVSGKKWSLV
jgi:hypothetical protein